MILSGGMDSATALWLEASVPGADVRAVSFDYGQRHRKELDAAAALARAAGVAHDIVDLKGLAQVFAGSALTGGGDVPYGHYADESMKKTVVPNRNMVFLALAGALAVRDRCDRLVYGAHAGDHAIYPDCRPDFYAAMKQAMLHADWHLVNLVGPFVHMTKTQIAALGGKLGVPYALTWSCYEGGAVHCGKCGTCVERREAFAHSGIPDPTEYAAP